MDSLPELEIVCGRGMDKVVMLEVNVIDASIKLGREPDELEICESTFTGRLNVETARGQDSLTFVSSVFNDLEMETGMGDDCIALADTRINGSLDIHMGEDKDRLALVDVLINSIALAGGSGQDGALASGIVLNPDNPPTATSVEIISTDLDDAEFDCPLALIGF